MQHQFYNDEWEASLVAMLKTRTSTISFLLPLLVTSAPALVCGAPAGGSSLTGIINGIQIRMDLDYDGNPKGLQARHTSGITSDGAGVLKRYIAFFDDFRYSGYDLSARKLAGGQYELTFAPLTLTPEQLSESTKTAKIWTIEPLLRKPYTQALAVGQVLMVDLFVNPATGEKIVEKLRIEGSGPAAGNATMAAAMPPRDFAVDDVELNLQEPKIRVNNAVVETPKDGAGGITGAPLWLYLKGHGRFVFSLRPHYELGFAKAGEVRGNTMSWTSGGNRYSIQTGKNIAPGDGVYHLYVFHSPAYRSESSGDPGFEFGAGGSLDALVRR